MEFAVQLAVLRFPGRPLRELAGVPPRVLAVIADQVQVPASTFSRYGDRDHTLYEHLDEIRQTYHFRDCGWKEYLWLARELQPLALATNVAALERYQSGGNQQDGESREQKLRCGSEYASRGDSGYPVEGLECIYHRIAIRWPQEDRTEDFANQLYIQYHYPGHRYRKPWDDPKQEQRSSDEDPCGGGMKQCASEHARECGNVTATEPAHQPHEEPACRQDDHGSHECVHKMASNPAYAPDRR
ncbi:DUF4158 domain-containing protein [Ktedonosporobacter rubrisoli]|uniref:DUF4158 domain-containing protein n=1 Tax=Ktedonosporobacter rubrisoli TaxID=2509675 RepID=A0A4P6K5U1_KTERU|nr:DUF4158 domain-containing protein [Ktedonosporobacter rubrisoli]